jgi:hypothetical protein
VIEIRVETGLVVYMTLLLLLLAGVALYDFWRTQIHQWAVSEEKLCRCDDCHCTFVVTRNSTTARCPRCRRLCPVRDRLG